MSRMKPRDKGIGVVRKTAEPQTGDGNSTLEGRIGEKHACTYMYVHIWCVYVRMYIIPPCNPAGRHSDSVVASTGQKDMGTHRTPL